MKRSKTVNARFVLPAEAGIQRLQRMLRFVRLDPSRSLPR